MLRRHIFVFACTEEKTMDEYITVKKEASDFFIEKKSRFIGYCKPVKTEAEALEYISAIKKQNYDATHNVYAYIVQKENLKRFSDDGEPQGKAGIPVLDAMEKSGITDAVIVATRYFGGTMLGGGGLIRAYSHTASIAIEAACKITMRKCEICEIKCDYNLYGKINSIIPECGGIIDNTDFLENVVIGFHITGKERQTLDKKLSDISSGRLTSELIEEKYFEFIE